MSDNYRKSIKLHIRQKGNIQTVTADYKLGNAVQSNLCFNNVTLTSNPIDFQVTPIERVHNGICISPENLEDAIALQEWVTDWISVHGQLYK